MLSQNIVDAGGKRPNLLSFNSCSYNGNLMLHYLEFSNFCSFIGPERVSFVIDEKAPDTHQFVRGKGGTRLSKAQAIIGANAAGKSNTLRALSFLAWFSTHAYRVLEPDDSIPVDSYNFYGNATKPEPLKFKIEFESPTGKGAIYRYEIELTAKRVIRERLSRQGSSSKFSYLMKREHSGKADQVETKGLSLGISDKELSRLLRPNNSFLSVVLHLDFEELRPVRFFFESIDSNVDRHGKRFIFHDNIFGPALFFSENLDLFDQAKQLIAGVDLGIADIALEQESILLKGDEELHEMVIPFGVHRIEDHEYRLPFSHESGGTQGLFGLLRRLLPVLQKGGVAIVDDFESELHPHMLPRLFDLFFNPHTNPKNAQLLFTTHAYAEVFRRFDKRQVTIAEKGEDGISHLYRLDEIKGIRQDDNMLAKYDAGAYGGIPVM